MRLGLLRHEALPHLAGGAGILRDPLKPHRRHGEGGAKVSLGLCGDLGIWEREHHIRTGAHAHVQDDAVFGLL
jgi:hypothetical protein